MNKLYEEYGQLMINLELLNNRISNVKKAIAEGLNKNQVKVEEPKEE